MLSVPPPPLPPRGAAGSGSPPGPGSSAPCTHCGGGLRAASCCHLCRTGRETDDTTADPGTPLLLPAPSASWPLAAPVPQPKEQGSNWRTEDGSGRPVAAYWPRLAHTDTQIEEDGSCSVTGCRLEASTRGKHIRLPTERPQPLQSILTFPERLPAVEGLRHHQELVLPQGLPELEQADGPGAGAQRPVQGRFVLGEFCLSIHRDVIGGSNNVRGVDPHHCGCQVGASRPLLHGHWLIKRPHQASKIAEEPFLGVPLCAHLQGQEARDSGTPGKQMLPARDLCFTISNWGGNELWGPKQCTPTLHCSPVCLHHIGANPAACDALCSQTCWHQLPQLPPERSLQSLFSTVQLQTEAKFLDRSSFSAMTIALCPSASLSVQA